MNPIIAAAHAELLKHNQCYDHEHTLTASDVVKVLTTAHAIENLRKPYTPVPLPGDIVRFTTSYGKTYSNALLQEGMSAKTHSICEQPYTPWATIRKDGSIGVDASGGAWHGVDESDFASFKHAGTATRLFCLWGHGGGRANGAVEFPATVNVWEYKEKAA